MDKAEDYLYNKCFITRTKDKQTINVYSMKAQSLLQPSQSTFYFSPNTFPKHDLVLRKTEKKLIPTKTALSPEERQLLTQYDFYYDVNDSILGGYYNTFYLIEKSPRGVRKPILMKKRFPLNSNSSLHT